MNLEDMGQSQVPGDRIRTLIAGGREQPWVRCRASVLVTGSA